MFREVSALTKAASPPGPKNREARSLFAVDLVDSRRPSEDGKTFDVIDGQQRLTTVSLIVLAVLKNLLRLVEAGEGADANRQRIEQIRQTYVGYLDPVTLVARPKLMLTETTTVTATTRDWSPENAGRGITWTGGHLSQ